MSRKLTVIRLREHRVGWSYRAHDFALLLNDVLVGMVKDGKSVSFSISEEEQLLEVRPHTLVRCKTNWCALIPAGKDDCCVTVSPWAHKDPIVEQLPENPVHSLSIRPVPMYFHDVEADNVEGIENCFAVQPEADLVQIVDRWLNRQLEPPYGEAFWNWSPIGSKQLTLILTDAKQPDRSSNGKEALVKRCLEHGINLMLDLGGGYYQELVTGKFFVLKIGETRTGYGDVSITYGQLEWKRIFSIPPRELGK